MREVCNTGYGRHSCEQFPTSSAADAIRFHVAQDAGELIHIQFIFEKECWPAQRGTADFSVKNGFSDGLPDKILRRQAEAFVESYLKRRNSA